MPKKGYKQTADHRAKASANHGWHRPEVRARLREVMRSPEVRAKQSAAHRGKRLSEEHKKKLSANNGMHRPEIREKCSASMKNSPKAQAHRDRLLLLHVSKAEKRLVNFLARHFGLRRQGRLLNFNHAFDAIIFDSVGNTVAAVEVDGCHWHGCSQCQRNPANEKKARRDREINEFCRSQNIPLIRVQECEVTGKNSYDVVGLLEILETKNCDAGFMSMKKVLAIGKVLAP